MGLRAAAPAATARSRTGGGRGPGPRETAAGCDGMTLDRAHKRSGIKVLKSLAAGSPAVPTSQAKVEVVECA
jgi:hypothetical protein